MAGYTLKLSEFERLRYRAMAKVALEKEGDLWEQAGIVKGARVVDLVCGPGGVLLELARLVGPDGLVVGVDQDAEARRTATAWAAEEGLGNVEVREGLATDSGLPTGQWDAVMLRHVLIHNGPRVPAILGHVLTTHGNDIAIGASLAAHAEDAGFEVLERGGRFDHYPLVPGIRPVAWAGRQSILDAGLCTDDDIARWDAALQRQDETGTRNVIAVTNFTVLARRPA